MPKPLFTKHIDDKNLSQNPIEVPQKILTDIDFMSRAREVSARSGCIRKESKFGAIAVKNGLILASGWNGPVGNIPPCEASGKCIRQVMKVPSGTKREVAHCICAEQRVICYSARDGISVEGATMYVTGLPCVMCMRLIVASGFAKVIYEDKYLNEKSYEKAKLAGLELVRLTAKS